VNSLIQWFPTGVPRHPRVPFAIPRGARDNTFLNISLKKIHFQTVIKP